MTAHGRIIERFHLARRDPGLAVLEGFHALKHALRFGADVLELATADPGRVLALAWSLAPDVARTLASWFGEEGAGNGAGGGAQAGQPSSMGAAPAPGAPPAMTILPLEAFTRITREPPDSPVVSIARRPAVSVEGVLGDVAPAPLVFLENPSRLGNIGAAIRVAAAAEAAGVLTTGPHDPWHPTVIRGSAGLHFALPVARVERLPASDRPLVAIDPGGEPLRPEAIPPRAILAFGGERHGLSRELVAAADRRIGIPMRPGVSSLNLATSVAAVLYVARCADPGW